MLPMAQSFSVPLLQRSKWAASCIRCTASNLDQPADELEELMRREKEAGVSPDPELDAFMRAEVRTGKRESIVTDLIIKMLGLDVSSLHVEPALHLFD